MWAGDQNVDWSLSDGLASTLTAALSMGISGVALTHFDIGGFTTFASYTPPLVRTEQLLLRSAEMAVFTPVFRTHEGELGTPTTTTSATKQQQQQYQQKTTTTSHNNNNNNNNKEKQQQSKNRKKALVQHVYNLPTSDNRSTRKKISFFLIFHSF